MLSSNMECGRYDVKCVSSVRGYNHIRCLELVGVRGLLVRWRVVSAKVARLLIPGAHNYQGAATNSGSYGDVG